VSFTHAEGIRWLADLPLHRMSERRVRVGQDRQPLGAAPPHLGDYLRE
jgi:hypothetical protein